MKKQEKKGLILFFVVAIVLGSMITTGAIIDYQRTKNPLRPSIVTEAINMSPSEFYKERNLLPLESTIFKKYRDVLRGEKGNKWTEKYKYVYIFQLETSEQRKAAAEFSRENYLNSHQKDAVDKKYIFSDQKPDPKKFVVIQEMAATN